MDSLDRAQQAAAEASGRIQLVLAGPGSGKTTTLTGRFIRLVQGGVDRRRILALTFTKKAADEMKERITEALGLPLGNDLTVMTFHGFSFRHLRRNPQLCGLAEGFELWDTGQQRQVFNSRRMWWNEEQDVLDIIGGAKERLMDAAAFAKSIDEDDPLLRSAVVFFKVYEEALRNAGAIDFADMVPLLVRAMDRHPDYAAAVTGAYEHVLVDEYQDVNPGQVELIERFVRAGARLWVVGDDDQTLYAFRAADVRFILDFTRRHAGAQVHVLDRNYRSAVQIVAAARRLIAHNTARKSKDQQPVTAEAGEIVIRGYRDARIEARQVAKAVARLIGRGLRPQKIAVLYRTGVTGLALQPAMRELSIPYEVRGAGDLWQSVAARLFVGSLYYLRGGATVEAMSRMGTGRRAEITREKLDQARAARIGSFAEACRIAGRIVSVAVPGQAAERSRAEWVAVVEAVTEIAAACHSLEQLEARIAAQSAALRERPETAVVLSTIHSAKGLEWEAVFLVGMEDGVVPHAATDDVEEERRVAYVGVTRARRILGLTYAASRFGQAARASPFLFELYGQDRPYIWTGPGDGSDDRVPLLSDRERARLKDGTLPPPAPKPPPPRHVPSPPAASKPTPQGNGAAPRQGKPWKEKEERRLRERFLAGDSTAALARAHQRKRGAIRSRLRKLGLIREEDERRSP
jgi:DNA helicase-2/ATP-dependent DNA helicase PcrA